MSKPIALEMKNISKSFGSIQANKNVSLEVYHGEILAILGENGCGKTTLMNMIAGIYFPDEGTVLVDGREVVISSPKDAFAHKIGMIHQHFKLVDVFTATENIVLGLNEKPYDLKKFSQKIQQISSQYGFDIDPNKKIYDMSVSEKQTVEIIKVLYRGADILILDEPTAVLTPQEIDELMLIMRGFAEEGKSILFITHKLNEIMAVADRCTVLRKGKYIGTVDIKDTDKQALSNMMVGRPVQLQVHKDDPNPTDTILSVKMRLASKDPDAIMETMRDLNARRKEKQPLELASAGSYFKRPEGHFAGKLIEDCGTYVCADRYCFGGFPGREPIVIDPESDEDALTQVCRHYVYWGNCPRMMNMEKVYGRKKYVADLAKEYKADGIIYEHTLEDETVTEEVSDEVRIVRGGY